MAISVRFTDILLHTILLIPENPQLPYNNSLEVSGDNNGTWSSWFGGLSILNNAISICRFDSLERGHRDSSEVSASATDDHHLEVQIIYIRLKRECNRCTQCRDLYIQIHHTAWVILPILFYAEFTWSTYGSVSTLRMTHP